MDFTQRLACICLVGAAFAFLAAECAPNSYQDKLLELLKKAEDEENQLRKQNGVYECKPWSKELHCSVHKCVPRNLVCNGVRNCPNGLDEDQELCAALNATKAPAKREDVVDRKAEMPVSNGNNDRSSHGELKNLAKLLLKKLEKDN